jgi:hypothetical protein
MDIGCHAYPFLSQYGAHPDESHRATLPYTAALSGSDAAVTWAPDVGRQQALLERSEPFS